MRVQRREFAVLVSQERYVWFDRASAASISRQAGTRSRIDFSNIGYYPRLYSRYYFQSKVTFYCLASNYPNSDNAVG